MPTPAPGMGELLEKSQGHPDGYLKIFGLQFDDTRYFSYEDIIHRPIPEDLKPMVRDSDMWWFGLQLQRSQQFRFLKLLDNAGNPFKFFLSPKDWSMLHAFDMQGGGSFCATNPFPSEADNTKYLITSLIEEAVASSTLEGAVTTREIAKKMIAENRPPKDKNEQMVLNNYKTMQMLETIKNEPFSPELICHIHTEISRGTLPVERLGTFRKDTDNIAVSDNEGTIYHTPPPEGAIRQKLEELCAFANTKDEGADFIHPVVKAIILHFMLGYIHPFFDGNGRTARTLFYWHLLRSDYWFVKFISISRVLLETGNRYPVAYLNTETYDNDLNYFIKFQLEVVERSIKAFLSHIQEKQAELAKFSATQPIFSKMNARQKDIVLRMVRRPHEVHQFTFGSHQGLNGISFETARQDLLGLEKLGLLKRLKKGKTYVFVPADDLSLRLR